MNVSICLQKAPSPIAFPIIHNVTMIRNTKVIKRYIVRIFIKSELSMSSTHTSRLILVTFTITAVLIAFGIVSSPLIMSTTISGGGAIFSAGSLLNLNRAMATTQGGEEEGGEAEETTPPETTQPETDTDTETEDTETEDTETEDTETEDTETEDTQQTPTPE